MDSIVITARDGDSLCVAAIGEDGTEHSTGGFTFTQSAFGGGQVKCLLAGGIGTPVHFRRGGNVRRMFEYMHRVAAQEGAAVALLHPFSFSYYRQFGYEKVADHLILRFPTRLIDFVSRRCTLVPYEASMETELIEVYQQFSRGRNLLLARQNGRRFQSGSTYVLREGDRACAYVNFTAEKKLVVNHHEQGVLTVHELAYTSPESLREIFSFLRMFEGEFDEIEIMSSAVCPEIDLLLRHYTHTRYTAIPDIMARVLNTEMLLRANTYPRGAGCFTLQVEDALPTVAGVFRVTYGGEDGSCQVERLDENAEIDMTLTAPALARLLYGYDGVSEDAARYLDGVTIHRDCGDFFRAFPKRACGIFEHF